MSEYVYATDEHKGHWLTGEEIVRCRNCKHFKSYESSFEPNLGYCREHDREEVLNYRFCAWGERKEQ